MFMEWIVVIAVIAIVVAAIAMKKNGSPKDKNQKDKIQKEKKDTVVSKEPEKSAPVIHYSEDFRSKESVVPVEDSHDIKSIIAVKNDTSIWICSYCEAENSLADHSCCVCYNKR